MKPATNLKVDIAHAGFVSPVEAVQGDGGLRNISMELTDSGKPWYPPAGTEVAVAYTHSNGTKGLYNKLHDGRKAVTVRDNIATVVLAPQMLAAAGEVKAAIVFSNEKLDQLTTFPITITVRKNLFADAQETVDYIRLQWLEDKLEEYLRDLKASGAFDGAPGADGHTPEYGVDYGTPEQIAGIAQQAADILQPEVNQIKNELSGKLPKSPADWEPWTAEQQAAAREKIGLEKKYELIEEISIDSDTAYIVRNIDTQGNSYHFSEMKIFVDCPTLSANKDCSLYINGTGAGHRFSAYGFLQSGAFSYFIVKTIGGMGDVTSVIGRNTSLVSSNAIAKCKDTDILKINSVTSIRLQPASSFAAGTKITIYGVRA